MYNLKANSRFYCMLQDKYLSLQQTHLSLTASHKVPGLTAHLPHT